MINNPVKLGVLGLRFGFQQMKAVVASDQSSFIKVAAVCDHDIERLRSGCAEFDCPGYDDIDSLLKEADIEAVALFTGPVGRSQLIRKILKAGKDVMTTKPFDLDPTAACEVLHDAKALGRVIYLNSPSATMGGDIAQILAWQAEFNLGDLIFSRLDAWYKRQEAADGSWYDDANLCPVAPCFRLGIYAINDLITLGGKPAEVQVLQSRKLTGRPTPDIAQLSIRFESGAIASIQNTWCCEPGRGVHAAEFIFERGVIVRSYDNYIHESAEHITLELRTADIKSVKTAQIPLNLANDAYRWDLFYNAVREGLPINSSYIDTIVTGIRVITAMAIAQNTGKTQSV